jgi:hypothetical protein
MNVTPFTPAVPFVFPTKIKEPGMHKILFLFLFLTTGTCSYSQNVGIGTPSPLAPLHVNNGSVLFSSGALNNIPPPTSGPGIRMMWYGEKGAFRAGYVSVNNWDKDSVGNFSFAINQDSKAKADFSVALGYGSTATGVSSIAANYNSVASGNYSQAFGASSIASGLSSVAMGALTTASGNNSVAIGASSSATQNFAVAMGRNSIASNFSSIAIGEKINVSGAFAFGSGLLTETRGDYAAAFGYNNIAKSTGSFIAGLFNDSTDTPNPNVGQASDRIFQLGNGTANNARSNAITILRTGNMGMGILTPAEKLDIVGNIKLNGSDKGILLDAQNRPLITRGWDTFTSGDYNGVGRWGLFMEASTLTIGIPNIADRAFRISTYNDNSIVAANHFTMTSAGNAGFGAPFPIARLHVADSNVLFTANSATPVTPSDPPVSGGGARLMWYADKLAFRSGSVASNEWDKNNIGNNSFASGFSTVASGITSFAMGNFAYAQGEASSAIGFSVFAKAKAATTIGIWNDNTDTPNPSVEAATDRIFQVGNGSSNLTRTNAITVLRNSFTGIGNTNPATRLDVTGVNNWDLTNTEGDFRVGNGTYRIKMGIALGGGGAGAATIRSAGGIERLNLGANNTNLLTLNGATGMVGIGTETPSQKLHVIGNILASGTITPSDARFKKGIEAITTPLEKIMQLNGVTYHYRANEFPDRGFENTMQVGVIAQDVEKIFPQLVFSDDKGYKAVDYPKLIPLLIEGMKEQQKQIGTQQQQIAELNKLVNHLIKKIR